jgi:hypothetical protein
MKFAIASGGLLSVVGLVGIANEEPTPAAPAARAETGPHSSAEREFFQPARGRSSFVPNHGQWDASIGFLAVGRQGVLRCSDRGFEVVGPAPRDAHGAQALLSLRFDVVTEKTGPPEGRSLVPETKRNYLFSGSRGKDVIGVPCFSAVTWNDVLDGVTLVLSESDAPVGFSYSVECRPRTGSAPIRLRVTGADRLLIGSSGELLIDAGEATLVSSPPLAWEYDACGQPIELAAKYALVGSTEFTIEVPLRNHTRSLLIDPGLEWAGYIGGFSLDIARDLALDVNGSSVVVGTTYSGDFPTTPGVVQPLDPAQRDGFVMRVSPDGSTLEYATYFGGSAIDEAFELELRPNSNVVLAGETTSTDFPVTPGAFDKIVNGTDAFVAELRSDGSSLLAASYYGGPGYERAEGLGLWPNGEICLGGVSSSTSLPSVSSGFQSTNGGGSQDAFVARIAADASGVLVSTYLGGPGYEYLTDLDVAIDGSVVCGGTFNFGGFPTTAGAFDTTYSHTGGATPSAFVTRLVGGLSLLEFSTYLDGNAQTGVLDVECSGLNSVYVVGQTSSSNFPTTAGAWDPSFESGVFSLHGFLSALRIDGTALVYSTFAGSGSNTGSGLIGLDVDASGVVTAVGLFQSDPFPATPGAYDSVVGLFTMPDAMLLRFRPDLSGLLYGTLLGEPNGQESAFRVAVEANGRAIVLANVVDDSFPVTPGSFDPTFGGAVFGGWTEGVLARIEMQPIGVTAVGTDSPACLGPTRATALDVPIAGSTDFRVACTGVPPLSPGALAVAAGPVPASIPSLGVLLFIDLGQPFMVLPALSNAVGYAERSLGIPFGLAGAVFHAQFAWFDAGGCGGTATFSASDALELFVSGH